MISSLSDSAIDERSKIGPIQLELKRTFIDRHDNLSISGNVFVDVIARCIPVSVVLYRIDE